MRINYTIYTLVDGVTFSQQTFVTFSAKRIVSEEHDVNVLTSGFHDIVFVGSEQLHASKCFLEC